MKEERSRKSLRFDSQGGSPARHHSAGGSSAPKERTLGFWWGQCSSSLQRECPCSWWELNCWQRALGWSKMLLCTGGLHSLPLATVSLRAPSTALVLLIHNRSDIFCRAHLMHALWDVSSVHPCGNSQFLDSVWEHECVFLHEFDVFLAALCIFYFEECVVQLRRENLMSSDSTYLPR